MELLKEVVYLQYQIKTQPQVYNMEIEIMENITIEILAEKLGGKLWIKEDKKRIYLDCGYNTKKMSTKTYVYQREDGTFCVSCYIDCPSQPYAWIKSQQEEVVKGVEERINAAIFEIENPELDYDEYLEKESQKIEQLNEKLRHDEFELNRPAFEAKMSEYKEAQLSMENEVALAYNSLNEDEKLFVKNHDKGKNTIKPLMAFFRDKGFNLKTSIVKYYNF